MEGTDDVSKRQRGNKTVKHIWEKTPILKNSSSELISHIEKRVKLFGQNKKTK